MPKVIVSGDPGETWTNNTGKVAYQLVVNWSNTCGLCAQFDGMISSSWPIPYHRSCRCKQLLVRPGAESQPFTDFRDKIAGLDHAQQTRVVGRSNLTLIERGKVKWSDVVTSNRVRDFREVVARQKLSVKDMVGAGVDRRLAEQAHATVHTPAHQLAAKARQDALDKLLAKGIEKDQLRRALAERLAARVGIGQGPSGPGVLPVVPGTPKPKTPRIVAVKPRPSMPSRPAAVAVEAKAMSIFEQMLEELGTSTTMVPVHEIRARIRAELGSEAASPAVFDTAMRNLRSEGKIRLLPYSDNRDFTDAQRAAMIPTTGASPSLAWVLRPRTALQSPPIQQTYLASLGVRPEAISATAPPTAPVLPGRPIAERIAADTVSQAKVEQLQAIGSGYAQAKAARDAQRHAVEEATQRYKDAPKGAAKRTAKAEMERAQGDLLQKQIAVNAAEREAREQAQSILKAPGRMFVGLYEGSAERFSVDQLDSIGEGMRWLQRTTVHPEGQEGTMRVNAVPVPRSMEQRSACKENLMWLAQGAAPSTIVHEMGHHFDFHVPGFREASRAFLAHRVGDEPNQKLQDVAKDGGHYNDTEVGRKDKFEAAFGEGAWYVGKDYGDLGTEITSMGLEAMFRDPAGFAQADPEYAAFLIGLMHGRLR